MTWPMEKLGKVTIGVIFVIFSIVLITKEQYILAVLLLFLLLIIFKLESVTELIFSPKGEVRVKFELPKGKIEKDIEENEELTTEKNFIRFQGIEEKVLADIQKRFGGEMKTLVHFMYGSPDKPEFMYTPDGSLNTTDALYFFEIKYVIKPELTERIVNNTVKYLKTVFDGFNPMAGKRLIIKLILASSYDIDVSRFTLPIGVEIEFYKI